MRTHYIQLLAGCLSLSLLLTGCGGGAPASSAASVESATHADITTAPTEENPATEPVSEETKNPSHTVSEAAEENPTDTEFSLDDIPPYTSEPYTVVNNNQPYFDEADYTTESFETYSELDEFGRCGTAYANVCPELMPTEERGSISQVHPSGWVQNQYDFVDGNSLYNRCHLIGYQLTGENANEENLITGTRYMNVEGMLPFEDQIDDYVEETENHVLYRVTPVYEDDNLVASGVLMEAWSVEDEGEGICFNVYCYNVQPGVEIDYSTGENREAAEAPTAETSGTEEEKEYILNTRTKKFHDPSCRSVDDIGKENRRKYTGGREQLLEEGYSPCGNCRP